MTNFNYAPFKAKHVDSEMSHMFNANSFSRYNYPNKPSSTSVRSPSLLNSENNSSTSTAKKTSDLLFERVLFTEKKKPANEMEPKQEEVEKFHKPYLQFNSPFVINDDDDDEVFRPFSPSNINENNHKMQDTQKQKSTNSTSLSESANHFNDEVLEIQSKNPFIVVNDSIHRTPNSLNKNKQEKINEREIKSRDEFNASSIPTIDNEIILSGIFNFDGVTVDLELTSTLLKWKAISCKK